MDENYFMVDDPARNARPFFARPMPAAPTPRPALRPPLYAPTYAPPVMMQPQPVTVVQAQPAPSPLRTRLGDLTLGDVVPFVAQLVAAFRPLPVAPTDTRDPAANLVNLTKYLESFAAYLQGNAQLTAAGAVAGKVMG